MPIKRPYPVSNIQIENQGNNNTFISTIDITFNWRENSSIGGSGTIGAGAKEANYFVDECDEFKIETYDNSLTLLETYTSINTIQWEYTYAQRVTDGIGTDSFYLRIYQVKDNYESAYRQFHAVSV